MKKWISWMAAGALSAVLLLSGCGRPSVHVMKAEASQEPFTLETKAVPEALHVAPVIPSVSGGLLSDLPDIGTTVEAGDVLFRIDSSQYESQAAALEAKIAESASSAPGTSYGGVPIDNSMEASLLKQGIITRAEYNRIKGRSAVASRPFQRRGAGDGNLASALAALQPRPSPAAPFVRRSAGSFRRSTSEIRTWPWQASLLSYSSGFAGDGLHRDPVQAGYADGTRQG